MIALKFPKDAFIQLLFGKSGLQVDMERQLCLLQSCALRMTGPVTP